MESKSRSVFRVLFLKPHHLYYVVGPNRSIQLLSNRKRWFWHCSDSQFSSPRPFWILNLIQCGTFHQPNQHLITVRILIICHWSVRWNQSWKWRFLVNFTAKTCSYPKVTTDRKRYANHKSSVIRAVSQSCSTIRQRMPDKNQNSRFVEYWKTTKYNWARWKFGRHVWGRLYLWARQTAAGHLKCLLWIQTKRRSCNHHNQRDAKPRLRHLDRLFLSILQYCWKLPDLPHYWRNDFHHNAWNDWDRRVVCY